MKARNTPCTECRKQRRKCIRPDLSKSCTRCERLGRVCQQASKGSSDSDIDDDNITDLQNQVEQLEAAIGQMELQLRNLRIRSNTQETGLARLTDPMIQHLMSNWKIKIKDGGFQIETGIKSIAELLQVSPNLSYLSPISSYYSESSFDDNLSETSSYNSFESTYLGETNLLLRFAEGNHSFTSITVRLIKQALNSKEIESNRSLLVPSTLLLDTKKLVNQFIDVFFTCHNVAAPLLHEATYRKRFKKVKDPMNDIITLALCSYVCSNPCEHIVYSAWEGRSMADFFYAKAKSILFDQFEEVEKRYENIVAVNLMTRYLHLTLKIQECRQLITISHQLCLDLREEYLDNPPPSHLPCFNYKLHLQHANFTDVFRKEQGYGKPSKEDPDKVLYARHATYVSFINHFIDYIMIKYPDEKCMHFPVWDYLEDEPDMTIKGIRSFNWLLQLMYHPFVDKFMKQTRQIHFGKECTLSFESILKMEEIMAEWALSTPAEFRLCTNLRKPEMCKKAIDEATDPNLIINFVQFHSYYLNIYTCLLQPAANQTISNQDVLTYVRQYSLEQALQSCNLLLYAVHHLSVTPTLSFCNYLLAATDYLFDAMDVLALLVFSSDQYIANEAKQLMKSCLEEIDSIKFMQDHQVPKHASPLSNRQFPTDGTADLNYYDQYPQPWYAFMYDITHSLSPSH